MSRILSTISISTGQISSQARQVTQAHNSSDVTRSKTDSDETVICGSIPTGGAVGDETSAMTSAVESSFSMVVEKPAVRFITSPTLRTISRGSKGLPVACAGQTEVQRPQIVQASVSNSC